MAVIIKKNKYFSEAIKPEEKPQAVKDTGIESLKDQIARMGAVIERLSIPKPKVNVVATIERDSEGKMEKIIIKEQ